MKNIIISVPDKFDPFDSADFIRDVAELVEGSYTSGHVSAELHWTITDAG